MKVNKADTGWKKLVLPSGGAMTLAEMQVVFSMAFTAAGKPNGCAMYAGKDADGNDVVYFSPGARVIFGSVMMLKGAVACERPSSSDVTLLCGAEAAVSA